MARSQRQLDPRLVFEKAKSKHTDGQCYQHVGHQKSNIRSPRRPNNTNTNNGMLTQNVTCKRCARPFDHCQSMQPTHTHSTKKCKARAWLLEQRGQTVCV